jgi:hypothetical protein
MQQWFQRKFPFSDSSDDVTRMRADRTRPCTSLPQLGLAPFHPSANPAHDPAPRAVRRGKLLSPFVTQQTSSLLVSKNFRFFPEKKFVWAVTGFRIRSTVQFTQTRFMTSIYSIRKFDDTLEMCQNNYAQSTGFS